MTTRLNRLLPVFTGLVWMNVACRDRPFNDATVQDVQGEIVVKQLYGMDPALQKTFPYPARSCFASILLQGQQHFAFWITKDSDCRSSLNKAPNAEGAFTLLDWAGECGVQLVDQRVPEKRQYARVGRVDNDTHTLLSLCNAEVEEDCHIASGDNGAPTMTIYKWSTSPIGCVTRQF